MRITYVHRTLHEDCVTNTLMAICLVLRGNLESLYGRAAKFYMCKLSR